MGRGQKVFIGIALILSLSCGFFVGKSVQANTAEPGSATDPLVSQSYVEKEVANQVKEMEAKVQELQSKAQVLQDKITLLENELSKAN